MPITYNSNRFYELSTITKAQAKAGTKGWSHLIEECLPWPVLSRPWASHISPGCYQGSQLAR